MPARSFWNRRRFLAGSLTAPALAQAPAAAPGGRLRAGAATSNITPPLGCSLAGYFTDRKSTQIHDELHVRALVLDDGNTRLALAVCDLCVLPRTLLDKAKQRIAAEAGIPVSNVLVSSTHTHSAPPTAHLFQCQPDPAYDEFVVSRIGDGVRRAVNHLEPARIGWGTGREERLVFHRRFHMKPGTVPADPFGRTADSVRTNPGAGNPNVIKPAGPTDPEVALLAVESAAGRPIAVVASYALHYVGGELPGHVTADYFGMWAEAMAAMARVPAAYPPFVAILANACSGNINNIDVMGGPRPRRQPYEQMRRVAETLAGESFRLWRSLESSDSVPLGAAQEELELGVRLPPPEDVAAARKLLAALPAGKAPEKPPEVYARETVILAESYPPSVTIPIQALRIGPLAIAAIPGEPFVELGLEIKARSPFRPTMMIGLANDYRGYIPTVEGHELGGYETWRAKTSCLETMAAPKVVAAALRQLARLA